MHFWWTRFSDSCPEFRLAISVLDMYEEHYSKGDFEVVSVACTMDEEANKDDFNVDEHEAAFKKGFSRMPWLAVPFTDVETRRKLTKQFIPDCFAGEWCTLVGSNGKLLEREASDDFYDFGADYYPFTKGRRTELLKEEETRFWQLETSSIHSLLASPARDFVISNQGSKVNFNIYIYSSFILLHLILTR